YQADLDTRSALVKSRAQVKVDLAARKSAADKRSEVEPWLKNWVQEKFGESSTVAHEFGFAPRRVGVKSAKTKAEAVELAQATREARHTMGKKKKQEIKGSVAPPNPPAPSEAVDAGSS